MLLSFSYKEINEMLQKRSDTPVSLGFAAPGTLRISYNANSAIPLLGGLSKGMSIEIKFLGINDNRASIELMAGAIPGFLLAGARGMIESKLPSGMLEEFDGHLAVLNLTTSPRLAGLLQQFELRGVDINESCISLDFFPRI